MEEYEFGRDEVRRLVRDVVRREVGAAVRRALADPEVRAKRAATERFAEACRQREEAEREGRMLDEARRVALATIRQAAHRRAAASPYATASWENRFVPALGEIVFTPPASWRR